MIARKGVPKAPGMEVPLVGKFLLVAGYCASYNPAKSDMRLFGRATGPDRRLKKGGGTRRAGYGRVRIGKVWPQLYMSGADGRYRKDYKDPNHSL